MLENLWKRLAAYALPWDTDCNPRVAWKWGRADMDLIRNFWQPHIDSKLAPGELAVICYGVGENNDPKWDWFRMKAPRYYMGGV